MLARPGVRIPAWSLGVLALGVAAGIALWWVASYGGDAFFHLARVRKLVDFGSISLRSVDEYRDGGLHPGYAFPLFHGFLALISKLAGVDPDAVVLHGPTALLPLSFLVTYESGVALFRSRWAGLATMLASFALLGLAPGHGGSLVSLPLAANASRMLILPALLALVFAYVRESSWPLLASVAAAAGAMTLTHPPHSALVLIVLGGFLVARALLVRRDVVSIGAALLAIAVPTGAVALWLRPLLHETAAHNPGAKELRHAFASYPTELDVFSLHSYRLKPELFGRGGAIAIAALVLLPLAVFARRRLWAALALGGMLAALAVSLLTFVFPHFADAVSISQARRLVGFSPRMFVLAGGAIVLARLLGPLVLPVALAAGRREPGLAHVGLLRCSGRGPPPRLSHSATPPARARRPARGRGGRSVSASDCGSRLLALEPAGDRPAAAACVSGGCAARALARARGRLQRSADGL